MNHEKIYMESYDQKFLASIFFVLIFGLNALKKYVTLWLNNKNREAYLV